MLHRSPVLKGFVSNLFQVQNTMEPEEGQITPHLSRVQLPSNMDLAPTVPVVPLLAHIAHYRAIGPNLGPLGLLVVATFHTRGRCMRMIMPPFVNFWEHTAFKLVQVTPSNII